MPAQGWRTLSDKVYPAGHIYDRHVKIVKELIERPAHPAPKVSLNPEITDFYASTTADFLVEDYETGPQVKNTPIAV